MTKNHFFKIVLLGITLYLVASQISGLVGRFVEFLIGLTPLPATFRSVVELIFQLGTIVVLAIVAYMIYQSKFNNEKWLTSFTLVQLNVFFGLVVINSVWNIVGYGGRFGAGFEFRFWMIRGLLFNLGMFIGLLIITITLKNSVSSAPKQVRYPSSNRTQSSVEKSSLRDNKTPPDLPV